MEGLGEKEDTYDSLCAGKGYRILSREEIFETRIKIVEQAKEIISNLPNATLMTLLNHVKWDKDRLLDNFFDHRDEFLKDAKVIIPSEENDTSLVNLDLLIDCNICYDSVQYEESSAMPCGHRFCKRCWKMYLTARIMDIGESQTITCPETGCSIFVGHHLINGLLLEEPIIFGRYHQLISNHFVNIDRQLRWCPGVGCGNAVAVTEVSWENAEITCSCGHNFCFLCGRDWHAPLDCERLLRWLEICNLPTDVSDSPTSAWIKRHTKECPKCKTNIEKNGGCNHMTCRLVSCGYHFCWICLKGLTTHTGFAHNCSIYDEIGLTLNESDRTRLQHFFPRFMFYRQAFDDSTRHQEEILLNVDLLRSILKCSWIPIQFFENLVQTLARCRRTLQYSYAFAYFLENSNQSEIFETNQMYLESATETLSSYLEKLNDLFPTEGTNSGSVDLNELTKKIMDTSAYCESREQVLLSHVKSGHEENFWTFRP